ncbi:TrkH family potassium uptake protein [Calidifontibacillus erzurumensis]|uniref:TrkH family potassium uptake protein n=2 Tax=Calidifontibacillus erzurumensis TaxID=2741433 RepID=A0A8J8GBK4_9BACI|nr:TrkH family potassium uptake protein [Calidifontibacillus erzurumensis]NSL50657.1 TrkH family potassium uptake protein [Calidifontibacillus erzurumensis]
MLEKKNGKHLPKLTSVQLIVLYYVCAVLFSTLLLSLPIAHKPGVSLSFIDALFTAVSAISVTGLTVVPTRDTFSVVGYFILMFVMQFGGIGIMTLGTFIWLIFGKKIGLKERLLIMTDQNQSTISGLVSLMKQILLLIVIIEAIGALILGTYFLKYYPKWQEAFFHGLFLSISATTNAGFDITGTSLMPYAHDYFVQFITMILIILGAIGFPVLIEVKHYLTHRGKYPYHFSLFTKITTVTFFALVVFVSVSIYLLEWNQVFADKKWHEAFFASLFQSVTTRSAGLSTIVVGDFSEPTLLLMSLMMFIGASPSSVGGGIRTTTFAIMCLSIFFYAKGRNTIKVFKREIDPIDITKAYIVITTAFMLCGTAVTILSYTEALPLMPIIFEVASAFGTCGLSMGITSELSAVGKLVIIALMFIGRIGIFSFLFLIRGPEKEENYHYPKEKIIIG